MDDAVTTVDAISRRALWYTIRQYRFSWLSMVVTVVLTAASIGVPLLVRGASDTPGADAARAAPPHGAEAPVARVLPPSTVPVPPVSRCDALSAEVPDYPECATRAFRATGGTCRFPPWVFALSTGQLAQDLRLYCAFLQLEGESYSQLDRRAVAR